MEFVILLNTHNKMSNSNIKFLKYQIFKKKFMCVLFFSSFVCTYAYANVYFKTTIIKQTMKIILLAGVPMSQAAPAYLITAHHLCAFLM